MCVCARTRDCVRVTCGHVCLYCIWFYLTVFALYLFLGVRFCVCGSTRARTCVCLCERTCVCMYNCINKMIIPQYGVNKTIETDKTKIFSMI